MRFIIGLLAVAAIGGAALKYKNGQSAPVAATPANSAAALDEPRAHHWPKQALDRVAEVKKQVATQRKQDELP